MNQFNIQRPLDDEGLSLEEKAFRASLGSETNEPIHKVINYSRISPEDLSLIVTYYVTAIKKGCLYFWVPLTENSSICLRPITDDEFDECDSLSFYEGYRLRLFYSIIGYNHIIIDDDMFLWKLVDFLCEIGLDIFVSSVHNDIQSLYALFFHFTFAVVDLIESKSLWEWYKINGTIRKFKGLNGLELDWVFLNTTRDYYSYFHFVQILGGAWGAKKLAMLKTCFHTGFSTLARDGSHGGDDSVEKLAHEIEMELSGEKDEHALAVEHMEQTIMKKAKKRKKLQDDYRKQHNIRKGVYAEINWG